MNHSRPKGQSTGTLFRTTVLRVAGNRKLYFISTGHSGPPHPVMQFMWIEKLSATWEYVKFGRGLNFKRKNEMGLYSGERFTSSFTHRELIRDLRHDIAGTVCLWLVSCGCLICSWKFHFEIPVWTCDEIAFYLEKF